jgi:hypothetical protein
MVRALIAWLDRNAVAVERAAVLLAAGYVVLFLGLQTRGLTNLHVLEWDSREMTLSIFRFHGSGLFPDDLPVDYARAICPPGWRALYWLGSLVVDPRWLSKALPFALFAVVIVQAIAIGRRLGGPVFAAALTVALTHCNYLWDRIVGANPRGFGFPLAVMFLRYTLEERDGPTLAVLLMATVVYPSVALVAGGAWAILILARRDRRALKRGAVGLGVLGLAMAALAATLLSPDPRIGPPITLAQLQTLAQRGNASLYPLPALHGAIEGAIKLALYEPYGRTTPLFDGWWLRDHGQLLFVLVALAVAAAGRRVLALPRPLVALAASSLIGVCVAQVVAYRLYFPDRMVQYTLPPLLLIAVLWLAKEAFARVSERHAALLGGAAVLAVELGLYGAGLPEAYGLRDYGDRDTATMRYLARLPPGITVAATPDESTQVQVFAHRKTLFSAITNVPHFYAYGLEMERRLRAFYLAYYGVDADALKRLRELGVDYLVADTRDFGADATHRSRYVDPWTPMAAGLIARGSPNRLFLGHPPAQAVVFRDRTQFVVDLRRL